MYANRIWNIWTSFFFFSEDHDPIHVHVVKGDDEAKIAIVPEIELVYNHGLKAQDVKRALKLAKMYKEEIIEAWNQYHDWKWWKTRR